MALNFNLLRNRFGNMGGDDSDMPGMQSGMLDPRRNLYEQEQDQQSITQPSVVPRPSVLEASNAPTPRPGPSMSAPSSASIAEPSPENDMFEAGINAFGGGDNDDGEGDSGTGEKEDETETGAISPSDQSIYQAPGGAPRGQTAPTGGFGDMFKMIGQAEPGEAEKAYQSFLAKGAPNREDYKPGKMDRLSAILGGASEGYSRGAGAGIKTAREVLERPYEQGLRDYTTKAGTLAEAARVEGATFGRRASLARAAGTQATAQSRADEQARLHDELFKKWEADSKARAASLQGVNWTKDTEGHVVANFRTPTGFSTWVGPKVGESLSEEDKRKLDIFIKENKITTTGQKDVARATSGFTLDREKQMADINAGIREAQANKDKAAERQLIIDRAVAQMHAQSAQEQEQHRKQINQMIGVMDQYGSAAAKYFIINDDGIPTAMKAGDPNDPVYQGIYDFLHPKEKKK